MDADGYVEDMYIEVQFNSQTRSGKYTGNLENGKPSGEGKFVVEDKNGKLIYEGPWENGEPSGKGHVDIQGYETNAFGDVKDSGYVAEYSGEVLDGVPSGSGQLHIEADGLAADFTGEWKEGEMNGYGELIIHSDPVCHMKGNYSDNDFSPTFAQLVDYLISAQNGYFLKDDQLSFIEENGDLFCGRPNSIPKSKLASSFDSAKFIKTQKAERKLVKVGGTVGQVTSFDLYGIKGEEIIYVGNKGTIYYGYIYGDTDLVVDSKTTLYLYPVSYFTYQTIENVYKQAVLCVYVKTK